MRNHALDGLRACAATLIVVFHLGLTALIAVALGGGANAVSLMRSVGTSGVDLFFTLSAVVLLRPYLSKSRNMDLGQYFWRRVKRLWPPFLGAWLIAGATVALVTAYPTWWQSALPSFDWQTWSSQAFIAYYGSSAYNFAWWTLTIEIMFYAVAPLLVVLLAGLSKRGMVAVLVASVLVAQTAWLITPTSPSMQWAIKFFSYASCFVGGIFLAMHAVSSRTGNFLLAGGIAVAAGNALDARIDSHVGFGLIYMAVVARALDASSRVNRWLSGAWLVWLGERSYSLFLTHYSVIALACWSTSLWLPNKSLAYFVISRLVALAGAMVVACLLFETIEARYAQGVVTAGQWRPKRGNFPRLASEDA